MKRTFLIIIALVLLILGAALAWRQREASKDVYVGVATLAFEESSFYTLDGRGPWWISFDDASLARMRKIDPRPRGQVIPYAVWCLKVRGDVSPFGYYGHAGMWPRHIEVSEVLDMKPYRLSDGTLVKECTIPGMIEPVTEPPAWMLQRPPTPPSPPSSNN